MIASEPNEQSVVVFIGTLKAGGAERVTVWLADELQRRGHRLVVLTHSGTEGDFFALPRSVKRETVGLDEGRKTLLGKLIINMRRCIKVRSVLKKHRANVILAMMPHESVTAVVASIGLGTRVVVSERNAPWHRRQDRIWTLMRRIAYRFSDVQVVQTRPIAEWLRIHAGCSRVEIIPNAVQSYLPTVPPVVLPSSIINAGRKLLLASGTKPYQKGFDLLLEAFVRIASDHPDWDLALPGLLLDREEGGISGRDILRQVTSAGLTNRVLFPGYVGNMADWYAAADIFVLSSRFEGFPNVLIEAMSAGCPCIAFDCETGPREIITDGEDGLLVREISGNALAKSLARAMCDTSLRTRLAEHAPNVALRYAPETVLHAWCRALGLPSA